MKKNQKANRPDPQVLRDAAEHRLGIGPSQVVLPYPGEDMLHELLHELRVHQVELSMQNEALQQTQLTLEESRDRYADLYDFAPVGYLTLTLSGMISEINLTGAGLLGIERMKLLQRRFALLVVAEDRDRWDHFMVGLFQHRQRQQCELSLKRSDKSVFPALLDCLYIEFAGVSSLRLTLTDISERKLKEAVVREKEEFFHMIAGYTGDFIAVFDLKGRRLYNNAAYARLFGEDGLMGTDSFAEIHPEDREQVKQVFNETVKSGDGMQTNFRFLLADGSIRQMESHGGVARNSRGEVSHVVVVSHDITARQLSH